MNCVTEDQNLSDVWDESGGDFETENQNFPSTTGNEKENVEAKENVLVISEEAIDESVREMTVDEWKREQDSQHDEPKFNLRKPGEGKDGTQCEKLYMLRKKFKKEDGDDEEFGRRGRQRQLDVQINFNYSRRGRGRGRGTCGTGPQTRDLSREENQNREPGPPPKSVKSGLSRGKSRPSNAEIDVQSLSTPVLSPSIRISEKSDIKDKDYILDQSSTRRYRLRSESPSRILSAKSVKTLTSKLASKKDEDLGKQGRSSRASSSSSNKDESERNISKGTYEKKGATKEDTQNPSSYFTRTRSRSKSKSPSQEHELSWKNWKSHWQSSVEVLSVDSTKATTSLKGSEKKSSKKASKSKLVAEASHVTPSKSADTLTDKISIEKSGHESEDALSELQETPEKKSKLDLKEVESDATSSTRTSRSRSISPARLTKKSRKTKAKHSVCDIPAIEEADSVSSKETTTSSIGINKLPPKLLAQIFSFYIQSEGRQRFLRNIASVCKYWFTIHLLPSLWEDENYSCISHLHLIWSSAKLKKFCESGLFSSFARYWYIDDCNWPCDKEITALLPYCYNVRKIELRGLTMNMNLVLKIMQNCPGLEELIVFSKEEEKLEIPIDKLVAGCPNLKYLCIHGCELISYKVRNHEGFKNMLRFEAFNTNFRDYNLLDLLKNSKDIEWIVLRRSQVQLSGLIKIRSKKLNRLEIFDQNCDISLPSVLQKIIHKWRCSLKYIALRGVLQDLTKVVEAFLQKNKNPKLVVLDLKRSGVVKKQVLNVLIQTCKHLEWVFAHSSECICLRDREEVREYLRIITPNIKQLSISTQASGPGLLHATSPSPCSTLTASIRPMAISAVGISTSSQARMAAVVPPTFSTGALTSDDDVLDDESDNPMDADNLQPTASADQCMAPPSFPVTLQVSDNASVPESVIGTSTSVCQSRTPRFVDSPKGSWRLS